MSATITPEDALAKAITKAGGAAALSQSLGVTRQGVAQWKRCPHARVLAVEALTGVSRHQLRPDVYGKEKAA